ncbi:hypothetical protein [Cohnella zeiphila]|uniref:STAS domain-containing protein n=1 Tax=Cohnella zeiphila TaxID=2761120 RepID=A0A7X0STA1_9BACL|nr:hypothetical protein [Cohnella zeiphila]MBB6734490.1 hypothetical protein [Cohnella zeiphila]
MGSFNIELDHGSKILKAKVEGTFSTEDGMKSVEAYQKSIAGLNVPDYEIDIDCTQLNVSAPETIPILEACFNMYKNDGFKKVTLRLIKNPILKMQLARVARTVQLNSYEIIEV